MKKYRHLFISIFIAISLVIVLFSGCADTDSDDDDKPSGITLDLAKSAAKALPAIPDSPSGSVSSFAVGDAISDYNITEFFKMQCYMADGKDNCPAGVVKDPAVNKYTSDSLIGLIAHAELYMENAFDPATNCTPMNIDAGSFVTDDAGGNTSTYLIDFYSFLDCVGQLNEDPTTQYYAKKTDTTTSNVVIVTRKHDLGITGSDESGFFQAYFSKSSSGDEHLLAFNTAGVDDAPIVGSYARSILIVNFSNRKFLVKHHGTGGNYVTAAGQGGINAAGVYEPGFYFAKSTSNPGGICIDNATRLETAAANCANENTTWSTSAEVASYLGMTATEQSELAGFIAYFTSGPTDTNLAVFPTSVDDVKHMPDRIE